MNKVSNEMMAKVFDYPDYWCDIYGRIIHVKPQTNTDAVKVLRPYGEWKTPMVKIHGHQYSVANIIAETFIPKPEGISPFKLKVYHLDGMPHNNSIYNLVWATSSEIGEMEKVSADKRFDLLQRLRQVG